jgi:hypothetical protein
VQLARRELARIRPLASGRKRGKRVTFEEFLREDDRERLAKFIDRVVAQANGPGRRAGTAGRGARGGLLGRGEEAREEAAMDRRAAQARRNPGLKRLAVAFPLIGDNQPANRS